MSGQRRSAFRAAISGAGAAQSDFDTPMAEAALLYALDFTSDAFPRIDQEIDRILDCSQQDVVAKQLLTRIMRWDADFTPDPHQLAIFLAYLCGVAAAPTGATVNQVMTISIANATAGSFKLVQTVGSRQKKTASIPYNATSAQIKRAIENLTAIGRNNTTVTGAGPFAVTILGNLAGADLPVFTADITGLTGAGAAVNIDDTTGGSQKAHAISRTAGFQPAPFSMITGWLGSARARRFLKSIVADTLRVSGSRATPLLSASVGLVGSGEVGEPAGAYVLPDCQIIRAARFKDCELIIDGVAYQTQNIWRDFELSMANGIIVDEDAYTDQDEDIHRAERADQRAFSLNVGVTGEEGDDLHAMGEGLAEVPVILRIGRSGYNVTCNIPKASISLRNPPISPDGSARRSKINLNIEPLRIPGDATTPFTWTAFDPQAATFLTPA